MFYAAYGSNLNKSQMEKRCPKSKAIGSKVLKNWKLCFRGVADIVPDPGASVMLGIYLISKVCHLHARRLVSPSIPVDSAGTIPQTSREILHTSSRRSTGEILYAFGRGRRSTRESIY